jgi:hypothetical protein
MMLSIVPTSGNLPAPTSAIMLQIFARASAGNSSDIADGPEEGSCQQMLTQLLTALASYELRVFRGDPWAFGL